MQPATVLIALLVGVASILGCAGTGGEMTGGVNTSPRSSVTNVRYPKVPKELDRKGLFALPENQAASLRVKRLTSRDWLHGKSGLTDRERGFSAEYDASGRLVNFSGHVDQRGLVEAEFVYAEGWLVEERHFGLAGEGGGRTLAGKAMYDYSQPKSVMRTSYSAEGEVMNKVRQLLDDAGEIVRIETLTPSDSKPIGVTTMEYDEAGNLIREVAPEAVRVYSYKDNVLTISTYSGQEPLKSNLHSTKEYTFDNNGNLSSYRRVSGDGNYWDKFTYRYNERGLPTQKTWSRLEVFVQDPYELTKYSYEYRD